MKKLIITSIFFMGIFSLNCFGQLRVDSLGHVSIASNIAESILSVGGNGHNTFTAQFTPVTGRKAVCIYNVSNTTTYPLGLYIDNIIDDTDKTIWGMRVHSSKNPNALTSGTYYGIVSNGGGSQTKNIGIMGGLEDSTALGSYNAGIYGSASASDYFEFSGVYAGYFNGNVRTTGVTYSNLLSPSPVSSSTTTISLDENDRGNSTIEKISHVNAIVVTGEKERDVTLSDDYIQMAESLGEIVPKDVQHVQTQMSSVRYSIEEESLSKMFPELVYKDADGHVSINYIEMVPLLVQSIKELNAKIEELQGNDVKKVAARSAAVTSIEVTDADLFSVSQNEPNPFTESTTIKLSIPKKTQKAALMVYDMSGKQMKQININERGKTSVNITSEGLAAGMYLYSLIADGKVVNTKRMILTK